MAVFFVAHFVLVFTYGHILRLQRRYLSGQKEIHKRLKVLINGKTNMAVQGAVTVVGFVTVTKLADDPSGADIFLIVLSITGISLYIVALLRVKGYLCDVLIVLCTSCNLAIMAISSLHFFLSSFPPLPLFFMSLLWMLFLVYLKVIVIDGVRLDNQHRIPPTIVDDVSRTELEKTLKSLVGECFILSVVIAVALIVASALWTDLERDYRRGVRWISVLDFLAFVVLLTGRLFDSGAAYEGVVLLGLILTTSLILESLTFLVIAGHEILILLLSSILISTSRRWIIV
ncbi:hypothetical protein CTI12_AA490870 [Artemisia annua]|uniref:Uncharacterized protein n=1 Tax=Artemisia annua TaxID=35608 RepID=A0A2U1LHJ9_ARTAN|nr:hypothetical protein CTI12_AA490870 [Artemisia annua]